MWGFQLWVNLPAADKMTAPRYQEFDPAQVPVAALPGSIKVHVIAGKVGEVTGTVTGIATAPSYFDIELPAGRVSDDRSAGGPKCLRVSVRRRGEDQRARNPARHARRAGRWQQACAERRDGSGAGAGRRRSAAQGSDRALGALRHEHAGTNPRGDGGLSGRPFLSRTYCCGSWYEGIQRPARRRGVGRGRGHGIGVG